MNNKTKSILLKVKAKGQGVVNFDGGHQKKFSGHLFFNASEINGGIPNNVSYAKKVFTTNEDGRLDYKLFVSNECVGKEIYGSEVPFSSQDWFRDTKSRLNHLTSRTAILRGYFFGDPALGTVKRKSSVTLPDFIQSNNAKSNMVIGTTAGSRDSNSLFYRESVGEIEYESKGGFINLKELSFMSLDYRHDREAFLEKDVNLSKEYFKETFDGFEPEIKYFTQKGAKVFLPERGFVFTNEIIVDLVKYYLTNLLFTSVKRKKAFMDISEVQIKLVKDPLVDVYGNEEGWITLDLNTIKNLDFEVDEFYEVVDTEEAKALLEPLDEVKSAKTAKKKEEKTKKQKEKEEYLESLENKKIESAKK